MKSVVRILCVCVTIFATSCAGTKTAGDDEYELLKAKYEALFKWSENAHKLLDECARHLEGDLIDEARLLRLDTPGFDAYEHLYKNDRSVEK